MLKDHGYDLEAAAAAGPARDLTVALAEGARRQAGLDPAAGHLGEV